MKPVVASIWAGVCAVLSLGGTVGCDEISDLFSQPSFVDVASERTRLINGLESYSSIEESRKLFPVWEVKEDSGLRQGDKKPPFSIYIVAIKDYSHLDFRGELRLTFFNNRLMEAWFIPREFEKYVDALRVREGVEFKVSKESHRWPEARKPPHTRILLPSYEEKQKLKFVSWEDMRLKEEREAWIRRYS